MRPEDKISDNIGKCSMPFAKGRNPCIWVLNAMPCAEEEEEEEEEGKTMISISRS
jgi:hypothetical protein